MENPVSFFTPVRFEIHDATFKETLTEWADRFFYFGGDVAVVSRRSMNPVAFPVRYRCQNQNMEWWEKALKVTLMATIIFPCIILVAKVLLRSQFDFYQEILCLAPLTLVRTEENTDLRISVLYNQIMLPEHPIFPEPVEIENAERVQKYSWDVHTSGDGSITVRDERVGMIWWEAMRERYAPQLNDSEAICVSRDGIEDFLREYLTRMGLREQELSSFVHYWSAFLPREHSPYILVQPVHSSQIENFLPEIQVEGPNANRFDLKRFYFRFEPVQDSSRAQPQETFFAELPLRNLGENIVIDLGGEVVKAQEWMSDATRSIFNQRFIQTHILRT